MTIPIESKVNGHEPFGFRLRGHDISSGLVVFLVAVPLCLGIALASGAPMLSGLVSGVVGGTVVAILSGSTVGISGPAAGLAVVVFEVINELGFEAFLLALVLAGFFQVLMGLCRAGIIVDYFPSAVIKGMVSGIGMILCIKQIPHAIGYDVDYEGDLSFHGTYMTLSDLGDMLSLFQPGAVIISSVSLIVMIVWDRPSLKRHWFLRHVHGAIVAILVGIGINLLFFHFAPSLALQVEHLVSVPDIESIGNLTSHLMSPDFSQLFNYRIWLAALTLAMIASLETLLAVEGVHALDPRKRMAPANRELWAQGIGNIVCGHLGGLPVAQVVLRSSINIQAGARSKASAVIQGSMILAAVLSIPAWLNLIPLASLAAVLLVMGYKLVAPAQVKQMYQTGYYHFVPFALTIIGLLLTGFLTGIAIGMATALILILREDHESSFVMHTEHELNKTILHLGDNLSFLNKSRLSKILNSLPEGGNVVIDATECRFMDYDVHEMILSFVTEANFKKSSVYLENFRGYGKLDPVEVGLSHSQEYRQSLSPGDVLNILKEGNRRFVNNLKAKRNSLEMVNVTRDGQFPVAIILSCIDSRTSAELIFDQGLGDVFSVRVAGNVINDDILGCMEFACNVSGSKLIVVLGHSNCGAIKGACADVRMGNLTVLLDKIKPAIDLVRSEHPGQEPGEPGFVQRVADHHVSLSLLQIRKRSPILKDMESKGKIRIVSAMHDIHTGSVQFLDEG